ncbi:Segregation and condensation protein B [hydrothermal vent metagenome]|uniref:Segregation and condensation protein B n=1 Tax=hydrothermal vent metagenome TaxID=652676 RepID=A0A3B0QV51_9ZZZZ
MDRNALKPVIEAVIFSADSPMSFERIAGVMESEDREELRAALKELVEDYQDSGRGIYIEEVAGGFQLRTRPEHAPWIRRLFKIGVQRVSRAALETLSIVAYRQPLTRAELEEIRGVDSAGVLRTLLEKRLVKIVGRQDAPGRPVVYGTTKEFLETFSLKDLSSLPTLKEIESLEEEIVGSEFVQGELGEYAASGIVEIDASEAEAALEQAAAEADALVKAQKRTEDEAKAIEAAALAGEGSVQGEGAGINENDVNEEGKEQDGTEENSAEAGAQEGGSDGEAEEANSSKTEEAVVSEAEEDGEEELCEITESELDKSELEEIEPDEIETSESELEEIEPEGPEPEGSPEPEKSGNPESV